MSSPFPLTASQVAFYRSNGYVQINDVFSPAEMDELEALTDEVNNELEKHLPPLKDRPAYQQVFLQVVNVWRRDPRFRKFTLSARLAGIAKGLIGASGVRLWHDHLMTKMPGVDSKPTDWHQDTPYWPHGQPGGMSIWIPMQDVDMENGCMHFVPRSHSWNFKEVIHLDSGKAGGLFDLVKDKPAEEVQRVYVPLKRGSVTFHNGLTFHAASKNQSAKPRKVLSIIYMADGTVFNGDDHPVTREIPTLEKGKPYAGEFFPLLETAG